MSIKRNNQNYLLALHSSTESFGVAVLDLKDPDQNISHKSFEIGRKLSNELFSCTEKLLPKEYWNEIARIAVTTGPGGFTGTRLSIAMARTIAQQLNCPLDGITSFALMAPRLSQEFIPEQRYKPFWIKSVLKRRGLLAGQYLIKQQNKSHYNEETIELKAPHLIAENTILSPSLEPKDDVESDVIQLLKISLSAHVRNKNSFWQEILPIYPTSPIDKIK